MSTVLWEQLPSSNINALGFADQVFSDFPMFNSFQVQDVNLSDDVNVSSVSVWFTDNNGLWQAGVSIAVLNIFSNDPLLASDDPNLGMVVPVSVTPDGNLLLVEASGLDIDLGAGLYWIGLTPVGAVGDVNQELHIESVPVVGQENYLRNPNGGFGYGSDWGIASALLGTAPFNGSIRVTGTVDPGDPCTTIPDDEFEDNDSFGFEAPIGDGTFLDLAAKQDELDLYSTVVCPGATLTVDTLFLHAEGNLTLALLDKTDLSLLAISTSLTDNEQVLYLNSGAVPKPVVIAVFQADSDSCSNYDMVVAGSCNVGIQTCVQNANSSGAPAQILITGSILATDDNLSLTAFNMPTGQPGYFIWATTGGLVDLPGAGISDGFLCLGSNIGRFTSNVFVTSSGGFAALNNIDTTMLPSPVGGPIAIMAGDTAHFQAWFRDGTDNNFTDAAMITWQ